MTEDRDDAMICDDAEYQEAVRRQKEQRERLVEHEARLKETGLSDDELRRALDPLRSFFLRLEEEIESYERSRNASGGRIDK